MYLYINKLGPLCYNENKMFYYTYKIQFVDGCYYYGSRKSKVKPTDDIYYGSPSTHKDKWCDVMFEKVIVSEHNDLTEARSMESLLVGDHWRDDPLCMNASAVGKNYGEGKRTPEGQIRCTEGMVKANKTRVRSSIERQRLSEAQKRRFQRDGVETCKKARAARKTPSNGMKGKKWVTDGVINLPIKEGENPPSGFRFGFVKRIVQRER